MEKYQTNMRHCAEHDVFYNAALWQCNKCFEKQKSSIVRLEANIKAWKDAWFARGEIIGRVSWEVPNIHYLKNSKGPHDQKEYAKFLKYVKEIFPDPIFAIEEQDPFPDEAAKFTRSFGLTNEATIQSNSGRDAKRTQENQYSASLS